MSYCLSLPFISERCKQGPVRAGPGCAEGASRGSKSSHAAEERVKTMFGLRRFALLSCFQHVLENMCRLPSCSFRPERSSNVAGRPKGQGQTAETLLDRRKKETNKSRVANHNRRSMADRKRNKGMIPSWPVAQAQWTDGRRGGWGVRESWRIRALVWFWFRFSLKSLWKPSQISLVFRMVSVKLHFGFFFY